MARIRVTFDGTTPTASPLLMHNERLADPINAYTRWLAEETGKRKKPEQTHEEIGRREFLGGGYWSIDEGPTGKHAEPHIPTWNLIRCLQDAARMHRLGKSIERGLVPVDDETPLVYDGPRDADEMWKESRFASRKGVGVGQKRVVRTRPCFTGWKLEAELELELQIMDPGVVNAIAKEAGRFIGIGDARPRFGRFTGSAVLVGDPADYAALDELDDIRHALAAASARQAIVLSDDQHGKDHPTGTERRARVKAAKNGR